MEVKGVRLWEVSPVGLPKERKKKLRKGEGMDGDSKTVLCSLPPTEGAIVFETYLSETRSKPTENK